MGGRAEGLGSEVCVWCVCGSLCWCVHDPGGAPMIAGLRERRQARRRLRGPPFSTILGFCLLTAGLAELSCLLVCLCAVSVSLVHSFHSYLAGGQDSYSFLISLFSQSQLVWIALLFPLSSSFFSHSLISALSMPSSLPRVR